MFGMNVEWDHQQPQGHHHRHRQPPPQQSSGGFFNNIFGGKKEEEKKTGHVYYYSTSSRPAPRRAETISVLPAGVKMPTGSQPQISYAADGTKYLVIPPTPKRSNSTRQIIVTSGGSTPKRKDSTASRTTPRRSNSTQVKSTSPPVSSRAPKVVGPPELVKQYENSQRNVARWVESVGDPSSSRTPSRARRTSTR